MINKKQLKPYIKNKDSYIKLLKEMLRLLKGSWIQGKFATSAKNRIVEINSPKAENFCVMAAHGRAIHNLKLNTYTFPAYGLLRIATGSLSKHSHVASWNDEDGRTEKEVLDTCRKAIKLLKDYDK